MSGQMGESIIIRKNRDKKGMTAEFYIFCGVSENDFMVVGASINVAFNMFAGVTDSMYFLNHTSIISVV